MIALAFCLLVLGATGFAAGLAHMDETFIVLGFIVIAAGFYLIVGSAA